ncbi:MAG TPA: DUF427 domain-containing protein [Herpetosiphonaceae bacterium]
MTRVQRQEPKEGQESVWDYPRPPRVEATDQHVQVIFDGVIVADTRRAKRVLETSHPPTYYIPPEDVKLEYLVPASQQTQCEFKGTAIYYHIRVGDKSASNIAWSYPLPTSGFSVIRDHLAFYPSKMDACLVDGELVQAQEGDFYGGWITKNIVGPFKGGPGTWGW